MRSTILQSATLFYLLLGTFSTQAQVTITADNFQRQAEFIDTFAEVSLTGLSVPTEGENQLWDYSGLVKISDNFRDYFDATADPDFPEALNRRERDLAFQSFIIHSDAYEAIDENGWYNYGRYIEGIGHSITSISGGPTDSLFFIESADIFEGRINLVQFPMTYQDNWEGTYIETLNLELSIAAFGLNHTPGVQQRHISQTREVVGYGDLIIPDENGMPSPPMQVLQLKVAETATDSFFLGGAPAPDVLLAAFGLSQGATVTTDFYVFYKPGINTPVLDIEFVGNQAISSFYHPGAANLATATNDVTWATANSFPNPISAGENLTITLKEAPAKGSVLMMDATGKLVKQMNFENGHSDRITLCIPDTAIPGLHLLQIRDASGQAVGFGKVMIK